MFEQRPPGRMPAHRLPFCDLMGGFGNFGEFWGAPRQLTESVTFDRQGINCLWLQHILVWEAIVKVKGKEEEEEEKFDANGGEGP
jgi:hypothetical protein